MMIDIQVRGKIDSDVDSFRVGLSAGYIYEVLEEFKQEGCCNEGGGEYSVSGKGTCFEWDSSATLLIAFGCL